MRDDSILRLEAVSKSFGSVQVLSDVSASVPSGSVVAMIGPNGSGKTTLIRTIFADLAPTSGAVS